MRRYLSIFLFLISLPVFSYHIVGGEIFYDNLGGGKYRITLKVYKDCFAGSALDGTPGAPIAYLTVFHADSVYGIYDIGAPVTSTVPSAFSNPCIIPEDNVCVQEGIYTYTATLPSAAGGYTVVYQRCCRNTVISNLVNPDNQGATYFTRIPGSDEVTTNSSPRFTKFPPLYVCQNVNFTFDHSAIDPDGDQLVYSLCAPYTGLDGCCASLNSPPPLSSSTCVSPPAACPTQASAPPYNNVLFLSQYSGSYPIDSNPAFTIDPLTGELKGTPNTTGQYVVGVCISEYRNNQLINTHFRDFQFVIIPCQVSVLSAVADQAQQCQGKTIAFKNKSINTSATPVYHWDFGDPALANDTSNLLNPTYTYRDTGIYVLSLIVNPGRPCTDTLRKKVFVYPPLKLNYSQPPAQCFKNNSFNFYGLGQYATQATFEWDFTSAASPSVSYDLNPKKIHFTQEGLIAVKLKGQQFSCRDSFVDTIKIITRPHARINTLPLLLCDPANIGFSNGSTSELPIKYAWSFSNGKKSTDFEPTQLFTPAGTYAATLTVETTEVCKDTSTTVLSNIVVSPRPLSAFSYSPHEASIFEPDISINSLPKNSPLKIYFDFGDGQSSTLEQNLHTYADYGNYTITQVVTNSLGCTDTSRSLVKILPEFRFWIPNSFTPDGNGHNDLFMPATIGISQYEFQVFNRWGERLFKTNSAEEGWNGKYKGAECPQGIYIWKIHFKNLATEESETRLGHVTLIRNP